MKMLADKTIGFVECNVGFRARPLHIADGSWQALQLGRGTRFLEVVVRFLGLTNGSRQPFNLADLRATGQATNPHANRAGRFPC